MATEHLNLALLAIARAIHIAASMLLLSVCIFEIAIIGPRGNRDRSLDAIWRPIEARLWLFAMATALLSGIVWFVLVTMSLSGLPWNDAIAPAVMDRVANQTQFGRLWQIRLVLWIGLLFLWLVPSRPWQVQRALRRVFLPLESMAFVASIAWSGHGATGPLPALHRVADVAHLLVASAWPTGLLPMGAVLFASMTSLNPPRAEIMARAVQRFSAMSLLSVALLIATGIINSYCLLGSIPALIDSAYGRVFLAKLICFASIMPLAARNLFVLKPHLLRASANIDIQPTLRQLLLTVTAESILAAVILAIVGWLGTLPPARV